MKALFAAAAALAMTAAAEEPASFPRCDRPLESVAVPKAPHGLYVLLFPGTERRLKQARGYLLRDRALCGADLFVVWSEIDKGPGASPRYDWSSIERQMAPWAAAGKKVNLIVWAVSDDPKAVATPDYVLNQVETVSCERHARAPKAWDFKFVRAYQDFMAEVVRRFGRERSVGYIRFGLGAGGETFPACRYKLKDLGFTTEVWTDYVDQMIEYERSLHSPKTLMVGLNWYRDPTDYASPRRLAERAAAYGIGIGSQGWSAVDQSSFEAHGHCAVDWCDIFAKQEGKVPLELQPLHPTSPDGTGVGSLAEMLPFALERRVQIVELMLSDWMTADVPSYKDYPAHGEDYRAAISSAAMVLGGL